MICAIVPARGGSKGVPRKNLRVIAGRPLVAHAIDSGLHATLVDRVLVSTDDEEIAAVAHEHGAEVPFLRPSALAGDDTPTAPVLQHAVNWLESNGATVEAVVLLQPTAPFRRAEHVDAAVRVFRESGASSAVSVCEVEHSPYLMYRLVGSALTPLLANEELNRARRQDQPQVFRLNGVVYVTARDLLMRDGRIVGDGPAAVRMSRRESLDIDSDEDLRYAEWLWHESAK